ncbi:hypothetical protein DL96DRAFT_1613127 [Flagelloscypha sp. PMI_526]|nr:hypothetical protein DL96DRAFT_1613127 [Flagelloscypha sp. PMI_526]
MSQDDMRWSEMVPPNSALTFAVILDDDLDPVAFSGAELLRTRNSLDRTKSVDGPLDVTDGHSQILSVLARSSTNPLSTIEPRTATLAYFQDVHGDLFHDSSPSTQRVNFTDNHNRPLDTRTQTSSTLEGLDVYLRGSLLEKAHGRNRHFSCFDGLEGDFAFDPRTSFDNRYAHVFDDTGRGDTKQRHQQFEEEEVIDEGFSETPLINARPRLLTRTTSKASAHSAHPSPSKLRRPSNSIPPSTYHANDPWRWSAIGTPTDPEALSSLPQRRRLRKTRTAGLDGASSPPPPDDTTSRSPSESNRRQIARPSRGFNNTYKHIKSSVQPEKDGGYMSTVKTEIKVKQRNV